MDTARPARIAVAQRAGAPAASPEFSSRLIAWQEQHGRNDLPWQGTRDAYRIWLSEIMLQQTQVGTVVPYYRALLARFPDVASLASADLDEVLRLWSGLGYYSRARNLHRAAQQVVAMHDGVFPRERAVLESLPGIGRSTAGAIAAFAYGEREAILDGNVKRVLARHFAIAGFPGDGAVMRQLWSTAEQLLPERGIERYTQALMDLGATVCMRTPVCGSCPIRTTCAALADDAITAYPAPRARKTPPVREVGMLILLDRGKVMLEKRAPVGIWGGLWSFPEFPAGADPALTTRERFGIEVSALESLPELKHSFTHFTLRIQPVVAVMRASAPRVGSGDGTWMTVADAVVAAIPVPVRTLLGQLEGSLRATR